MVTVSGEAEGIGDTGPALFLRNIHVCVLIISKTVVTLPGEKYQKIYNSNRCSNRSQGKNVNETTRSSRKSSRRKGRTNQVVKKENPLHAERKLDSRKTKKITADCT